MKILIVEDEKDLRSVLEKRLKKSIQWIPAQMDRGKKYAGDRKYVSGIPAAEILKQTLRQVVCRLSEKFAADFFYRHVASGPETKGSGSLIEQHIQAIHSLAAFFFCFPEQSGAARVVDNV